MLEYNTLRDRLEIKEYGRNVQKMVEKALQIEDYAKRTEMAKAIVRVMSQINPETDEQNKSQSRDDYWHKLWDHLYIISDYKLDVDSPFPKPERMKITKKEFRSDYGKENIKYRTYGRNIVNVINALADCPDDKIRSLMGASLANHLKKLYLTWNRVSVDDDMILNQFAEMSQGKIQLPEGFQLDSTRDILANSNFKNNGNANNKKKSKRKKRKKEDKVQ